MENISWKCCDIQFPTLESFGHKLLYFNISVLWTFMVNYCDLQMFDAVL